MSQWPHVPVGRRRLSFKFSSAKVRAFRTTHGTVPVDLVALLVRGCEDRPDTQQQWIPHRRENNLSATLGGRRRSSELFSTSLGSCRGEKQANSHGIFFFLEMKQSWHI